MERGRVDYRLFAIGILSVTAAVLFVGLMLVSQPEARATGMNDRGGDYIMLTQQISATSEGVVVVDASSKQMIIYEYDYNNRNLAIVQRVNLQDYSKIRGPEGTPPRRGRP